MQFMIPILMAGAALAVIYYVFARSGSITIPLWMLDFLRKQLFLSYFTAILFAIWSGFGIATFGMHLGWLRLISLCLGLILAPIIGYSCMRYRLGQAHVDEKATQRMLEGAAEVREMDEQGERDKLEVHTIPGIAAWKVFLILGSAQALGAVAGYFVTNGH